MHEGHFTEEIIEALKIQLKAHSSGTIKRAKIRIGEMLHLQEESLRMHFKLLTQGGPLENTELEIEQIPLTVFCHDCRQTLPLADHHMPMCPNCQSFEVKIESGREVVLDVIELEEEQ